MTVTESATSPASPAGDGPYLVVEELSVRFPTADGLVQAVTDLSFDVELGKTLGIVGESGSGKSVSSMSVMSLHDNKRAQTSGSIRVDGDEIIDLLVRECGKPRHEALLHALNAVANQWDSLFW